ncbi:unnamed protein product [Diatraea saccharalis]|uniref:Uncharacterized protein n=1 Tax=Diatraea saccharalis TaxID=40085 RepID=A0A9N9WAQ6_9NEOP|nr:unnamed protein product [Diatraea saccharalis]
MVVFLDIDKFLTRKDFSLLKRTKWPWKRTHFILATKCHNCKTYTDTNLGIPTHFVIFSDRQIIRLLNRKFFWCQTCLLFTIYDHFLDDECEYCYK